MSGIKLSPKHGVNPTIPVCFWCGKPKNEIAMLGHIGDLRKGEDYKAPMQAVLDYNPCEECVSMWAQGVACIEVHQGRPTPYRPPIDKNRDIYPTGRITIVTCEAAKEAFDNPNFTRGQRVFIEDEAYKQIFAKVIGKDEQ